MTNNLLYINKRGDGWAVYKQNCAGPKEYAWSGSEWSLSVVKVYESEYEALHILAMLKDNKINDIAYRRHKIYNDFARKEEDLHNQLEALRKIETRQAEDLAKDCLRIHDGHEDNGGFMYAFCKRCGICLG